VVQAKPVLLAKLPANNANSSERHGDARVIKVEKKYRGKTKYGMECGIKVDTSDDLQNAARGSSRFDTSQIARV
jgi:hypothetical protein